MAKADHPEEMRLSALMKEIRAKAKKADRTLTDGEKKQMADLKRQLGTKRFMRLAGKRVNSALKQIKNVGKLASGNYACTPDQAKRVVDALADAVTAVQKSFAPGASKKEESAFTL